MKTILLTSLSISVAATFLSCNKTPVSPLPDPEPASSFSRTLIFPNRNGQVNVAIYSGNNKIETGAALENNKLNLYFNASPKTNNTAGEAITLKIDGVHLATGLVNTYDFTPTGSYFLIAHYIYTFKNNSGDIWSSFTGSDVGTQFEGYLAIEKHDKSRNLISGTYSISAKKLMNDPTQRLPAGSPIDPINQCDLVVNGSFTNIKILQP